MQTYFLDLSNPGFSIDASFGSEHTSTLMFDASVSYPKDEPPPDGSNIADRIWRLAIYDQSSEPTLGSPEGAVGTLRWNSNHSSEKRYGCVAQCEIKATLFSRIMNLLQAGNRLTSAEVSVDFSHASLADKGNTAPILVFSVNGDFDVRSEKTAI